jgi:ribosomal protein S18 acetylase RimI-like enzyme
MENIYQIKTAKTDSEIEQCWDVVFLLRPHLNKADWFSMVSEMMKNEKYSIAGIVDGGRFVAFAGYRVMTSLHSGLIIYVDDLCTLEAYRGKGFASKLLTHVKDIARSSKMDAVVLDTDFNNNTAQKLYLKEGFRLAALHLSCKVR